MTNVPSPDDDDARLERVVVWVARWSVVEESRLITTKMLVTPHQGYLDNEKLAHRLLNCCQ